MKNQFHNFSNQLKNRIHAIQFKMVKCKILWTIFANKT